MYPTSRDVSRIKDTGGGRACQRDEATYPSCETGAGASRSGLVFGASEKARSARKSAIMSAAGAVRRVPSESRRLRQWTVPFLRRRGAGSQSDRDAQVSIRGKSSKHVHRRGADLAVTGA